jgi:hypothetical protein
MRGVRATGFCLMLLSLRPNASAAANGASQPVQVQMRNVDLHVDEATIVAVRRLRGELISMRPGQPPVFDDKNSFRVRVDSAEIAISAGSLSNLLNRFTFAYEGSPISDLAVTTEEGRLRITGRLRHGLPVPFVVVAEPLVDPDGSLRLKTVSAKAFSFVPKRLMSLFGIKFADLVRLNDRPGVRVDRDDFVLSAEGLVPPPRIEGRLQQVRVERDRLVQLFGPGRAAALRPPDPSANYMYYRGGVLRFGKLTMTDTDMELIDQNPEDPFDFFQDRYADQLVAGYSKNTEAKGLEVFMPDYHRLHK